MTSDEELTEQKERNLLSTIKNIKIPWKGFLNWNLLFLVVWIFSLLYMFLWSPAKQDGDPTIMNFLQTYTFKTHPLEWAVFNFIVVWGLLFAVILLIENRERFIPAWLFVLISLAIGMYGMMPYFALRSVWRKNPKTKKSLYTKIVDSRILGIILAALALALLLAGIIATSISGGWIVFADNFLNVRLIQVMTVDFALFALFYPIIIWDDMKRRNWKNIGLFVAFSIPIIGAIAYVAARPRLPEGETPTPP
ncbi:MAG: hypothetical protein ACTSQF_00745 [Candidatus Heimdallarchaeaceae archaeon]